MTVDFDLHGRVLVRLLDAPAAAVSAVTADTGIRPGPATAAAPTITVEFTDDLHLAEPVRRVGRTSGFAGSQFVVGDSPGRRCVVALGTSADFTLRAERAVRHVPHLLALVNIAMLRAGALPLHAAALLTPGGGLVVTGWSKGGKTETVLGLMSRGATFVADEWCYLDPVQRVVLGLRHPIRVWDWQLAQLPVLRAKLTTKQRARLAVTSRVTGPSGLRSRTLRTMLEPTRGVTMPPDQMFGAERLADSCPLDRLVLIEAHDDPSIRSHRIDAGEVAARMRASLAAERADLVDELHRFRFAFPEAPTPAIDEALAREPALLDAALAGAPAWLVSHPYPVDLAALAAAVEQLA